MLSLRIWVWKALLGERAVGGRLLLTKDSKGVSSKLVKPVSANLRKIGCRCVIDEQVKKTCKSRVMSVPVHCVNRFESLAVDVCSDDNVEDMHRARVLILTSRGVKPRENTCECSSA